MWFIFAVCNITIKSPTTGLIKSQRINQSPALCNYHFVPGPGRRVEIQVGIFFFIYFLNIFMTVQEGHSINQFGSI